MSLDSYIGRTVMSIVKLFTERNSTSVKNALNLLAWDKYGIDNLMKVCKTNKLTIWTIDSKDLAYSCPSIADRVLKWRNWKESMGEVKALKLVLQDYRVAVFEKDTQFNQVMRSVLMAVESLLDYFDYDYVEDFQLELEEINERLNARIGNKKAMVKIATVHEFKGKEADSVYVWNDSEDVYPIKDAMDSLESLEEERRIHYIACTRAKQISTIVYLSKSPGMFIDEMDLSEAQEITGTTSGVLKQMKEDLEMNANMREFEKVVNKRTEDNNTEESQGSIKENSQPPENKPTVENKGISEGLTFDEMSDEEFFGGLSFPSSVESDLYQDNEFWGTE